MKHLDEEELVLNFYGELADTEAARAHLASCEECVARERDLRRELELVAMDVPPRGAQYPQAVWRRLQSGPLGIAPVGRFSGRGRKTAGILALAASLVFAFLLGRGFSPVRPLPGDDAAARKDRVLVLALDRHLERSEVLLVELSHEEGAASAEVISRAADLVAANRLYRRAAVQDGEAGVAAILDELERVLLEAKNGGDLRGDGEGFPARDVLFKVRVMAAQLHERARRSQAHGEGLLPGGTKSERIGS